MAEMRTTIPTAAPSPVTAPSPIRSTGALTIGIGAATAVALAARPEVPAAAPVIVLATLPAVRVDIRERRLPDRLVAAAALVAVVAIASSAVAGHRPDVVGALLGALALSGPLLVVHLVSPAAMGFGDVKLALVLGSALGLVTPTLPFVALVAACAGAATVGLVRRQSTVAFGPALLLGSALSLAVVATPLDPLGTDVNTVNDEVDDTRREATL